MALMRVEMKVEMKVVMKVGLMAVTTDTQMVG